MESAIGGNWVGAVISLPAAAAVIFMVMKFLTFISAERAASNKVIEKVVETNAASLKQNTDRLGEMSVTLATTLSNTTNGCNRAQERMDAATAELRRRKDDLARED